MNPSEGTKGGRLPVEMCAADIMVGCFLSHAIWPRLTIYERNPIILACKVRGKAQTRKCSKDGGGGGERPMA